MNTQRGHFVMTNIGQPPIHNQPPAAPPTDRREHTCDATCVCPIHGTQLYYARRPGLHACQDPRCIHANGVQPQETAMAERPPTEQTLKETTGERTHPEENRPVVQVHTFHLPPARDGDLPSYVVGLGTTGMQRALATCPYPHYAELVAEALRRMPGDEVQRLLDRG